MGSKAIKVCHMTSAHEPGDQRIFYKECKSLAKAGDEVYLVQRGKSGEEAGVHIVGVGQPSGGRLSRMTTFARKVYEAALALDAELYHLHDPELLPYGLKLKKKGKKVIFDSHELYAVQMANKPYLPVLVSKCMAWCYRRYECFVFKRIDAVIYPCTFNGVLPYERVAKRVVLIDNVPKLDELYDQYRADVQRDKTSPMCYIGSMARSRCIKEIVLAAGKTGIPLVMAGGFSTPEFQREIEDLLKQYTNISWLGPVPHDKVASIMHDAYLGLCPEKNEGQYNTVDNLATKSYEYMSMGLPVIVADYLYSRKVMETYQYGICVDPDDVDSIAQAMQYLYNHSEEARQMGENGRRAVKETFNWGVEEKKLLALYDKILSE